ncbi:hypothetical protein [Streptacidiphilus neutrinimicus]|uniref:hypothetical protein n=1 Tax=Streptacidiphilus neutrinimicus TaxID=105420 RepID=UPI0005A718B8|nr:hypothetical protein [Streptacidiphilus neutrinimicus]
MHLVHIVLTHPDLPQPSSADAERVLDILWAHVDHRSGIEHIRTRPGPGAVDLGLFFSGDGSHGASHAAAALAGLLAALPGWAATAPR